ncbi:probable glycine dehydrogenase (decarboxylating) subunit 2 [Ehrlichia ruminantium]|uniref:Probable glycine dehydrogenase (Decarboxylating) subunit 2 n=1 Tax=Ehrlichia ruminantium TaxID=779 RepID=A0A170TL79_EHRRU|nr:probable glycine dehydrogenase (decarboxylating) subunit 2 [Ehrlichia ruminantium]GAT77759.1 probable glycine dehydrogenase (decarboxylating) subunit 2 [Ehrlichia ruminantium]GAT78947.1 probable glycine dehydrogenase (decarboxylating) subunit 2 [Ehrlichia ruminantium]
MTSTFNIKNHILYKINLQFETSLDKPQITFIDTTKHIFIYYYNINNCNISIKISITVPYKIKLTMSLEVLSHLLALSLTYC